MNPNLACVAALSVALLAVDASAQDMGNALTPEQSAAIDRYVVAEMARERIPGAEVGVYRDGHAVLERGYGLANVELQVPVGATTLMQSGSVGKQFAATAVMMLVDEIFETPDTPARWC